MSPQTTRWMQALTEEARLLGESRMIRDEQPVTPELSEAVLKNLRDLLERTGKSQTWAAKSMGISAGTLSAILGGSYPADAEAQIRKIDKWVEQQALRECAPKPPEFVKTSVAEKIYGVARWVASKCGGIGIVHGPAGCGKTITAQAIAADITGAIFISIRTVGQSKAQVIHSLAQAIRPGSSYSTAAGVMESIEQKLADSGRLIIVDEIHKLAGRRNDEALHALRDLHDATGCPMLWLGMTKIAEYLRNGNAEGYDPICQIFSRVSMWLDLTELAMGDDGGGGQLHTIEDVAKIFARMKVRLTKDGVRYMHALCNTLRLGGLRQAKYLALIAMDYTHGEKDITAEMLEALQQSRLSRRAAAEVSKLMQLRPVMAAAG